MWLFWPARNGAENEAAEFLEKLPEQTLATLQEAGVWHRIWSAYGLYTLYVYMMIYLC